MLKFDACFYWGIAYFPAVLYRLLKIYARIAIKIYCRKVRVNKPALLKSRGPVLFAAP